MRHWQDLTCLTFRRKTSTDVNYIDIVGGDGYVEQTFLIHANGYTRKGNNPLLTVHKLSNGLLWFARPKLSRINCKELTIFHCFVFLILFLEGSGGKTIKRCTLYIGVQ